MFEIHLTVETNNIEKFKIDCLENNVKPIVIELQDNQQNAIMQDVMTSSKYKCTNIELQKNIIYNKFKNLGYNIKRIKVEVDPFHHNKDIISGESEYYESHIRIVGNDKNIELVKSVCKQNGLHLSKNIFKKIDGENYYIMATLREYNTDLSSFVNRIESFKYQISSLKYDKIEIECCVYDSNNKHDDIWINS